MVGEHTRQNYCQICEERKRQKEHYRDCNHSVAGLYAASLQEEDEIIMKVQMTCSDERLRRKKE